MHGSSLPFTSLAKSSSAPALRLDDGLKLGYQRESRVKLIFEGAWAVPWGNNWKAASVREVSAQISRQPGFKMESTPVCLQTNECSISSWGARISRHLDDWMDDDDSCWRRNLPVTRLFGTLAIFCVRLLQWCFSLRPWRGARQYYLYSNIKLKNTNNIILQKCSFSYFA